MCTRFPNCFLAICSYFGFPLLSTRRAIIDRALIDKRLSAAVPNSAAEWNAFGRMLLHVIEATVLKNSIPLHLINGIAKNSAMRCICPGKSCFSFA